MQEIIPIKRIYEDGIFELNNNRFSKTYKFTDVNYAVAGQEEKEEMFLNYGSGVLNVLDCASYPKLTIVNRKLNKVDFNNKIKLKLENDNLTKYRKEFNEVLSKNSIDSQGMIQEKLLSITIEKRNIDEARNYFRRKEAELSNNFSKLNSKFTELDLKERLRLFYDFFRTGEEDLYDLDIKNFLMRGHNIKDYICPSTFEFKKDYFKMGERYGRVVFLKECATFMRDNILTELTELNKNMLLSMDIKPIPMEVAIKKVEQIILGVETNIANWQKKQNDNNNFSAVIPYDLQKQREESKEFLDDLISRDQKMFLGTLTIVHTADSKKELDNDTENIINTAIKNMCQIEVLKYQQIEGLNTCLPYGTNDIKTSRTLTTESLSVFMPFKVQEIQDSKGIFYGKNTISKNMILVDKNTLQNGNSFILGISGSGKSFMAKQEITQIALRDKEADIIVLDPEAEYKSLIKALGGEVIKISSTSDSHINALDLSKDYDEKNPITAKAEFILSLCEQVIKTTTPNQKAIIDRCAIAVYRYYKQGNYEGTPPTLEDFRKILLEQPEKEAKDIALALELFTSGSLNTFSKQTNVEIKNRLICFDINDLGEQLMPIGMLVIVDNILNRIAKNKKKGKRTYIFIDEIYLLFKYERTAIFVTELWKRIRKYGGNATGISQNVEELLKYEKSRLMLANSEFLVILNQASTDRIELSKLLNISELQMNYITNVGAGEGLLKVGNSITPFINKFPTDTELYKLMTTRLSDLK